MEALGMLAVSERLDRQRQLQNLIKKNYPGKEGFIFCSAGYEREREQFYQESTFEYLVGLQEPAIIFIQNLNGQAQLYIPKYSLDRAAWLPVVYDEEHLSVLKIEQEVFFGEAIAGYATGPFYTKESLKDLCAFLEKMVSEGNYIFVPFKASSTEVKIVIEQLFNFVPGLKDWIIDISPLIAQLRRSKSTHELEYMHHAIEITAMAQQAAATVIKKGNSEADVQAAVEYIYTESNAQKAFASVVGSGVNSTILHYIDNKDLLPEGALVVVDIGASFNHYCADITRTYPVSGKFTERQKKVYQDVLETQEYIAELAKPGMYLNNKNDPQNSLNHLAHEFLKNRGYNVEKEFPHGIGHFIGLDVHDVGDVNVPLSVGDVITIEPGIYIREEKLGVRIEDMYWIVKDGAVCLSEDIPKKIKEIEQFMREMQNGNYENGLLG